MNADKLESQREAIEKLKDELSSMNTKWIDEQFKANTANESVRTVGRDLTNVTHALECANKVRTWNLQPSNCGFIGICPL